MKVKLLLILVLFALASCDNIHPVYVSTYQYNVRKNSYYRDTYYYHLYDDCYKLDEYQDIKVISIKKARELRFKQCSRCKSRNNE
jgi:hypothetical protein